jgi:type IV secretory pathway VirB2 component (pilin)
MKRRKRWAVTFLQSSAIVVLCARLSHLMADISYGSNSDIGNFFGNSATFLIKTMGGGMSVFGLIWAGGKIIWGHHDGLGHAVLVLVGGILIFMAPSIIGTLMTWTNVH